MSLDVLVLPNKNTSFHHLWGPRGFPSLNIGAWKWRRDFYHLQYEWLYISDLVTENAGRTTLVGTLHPLYQAPPAEDCTNPSAALSPAYEGISVRRALKELKNYDVLICSVEAALEDHPIYRAAISSSGVRVVILDHPDHEDLLTSSDKSEVTRGLKQGVHFDIYFKKDLPLCFTDLEHVYPIAPDPIRLSAFPEIDSSKRSYSVFFSGVLEKPITYENRKAVLHEFEQLEDSFINVIDVPDHYKRSFSLTNAEMHKKMMQSRFILSPAGRSWTTTRHTMASTTSAAVIMPRPDIATVGPTIDDGVHAITFPMLRYEDETAAKKISRELVDRVRQTTDAEIVSLSKNWRAMVQRHHTTSARARYILEVIGG